jgi:hypothetical protein
VIASYIDLPRNLHTDVIAVLINSRKLKQANAQFIYFLPSGKKANFCQRSTNRTLDVSSDNCNKPIAKERPMLAVAFTQESIVDSKKESQLFRFINKKACIAS